jgi:hypothetical protein
MESVVLLFACLASLLLVTYPVFDFDLYWHLANGREMVNSTRIVSEEVFSYTHPGEHFANHEWLAQIIFYVLWNAFGAHGLLGFKLVVVALISWLLFRTLRNEGSSLGATALLVVLVVLAGINRYHERPELFSLFNTALLGFILYGFRSQRLSRKLLWTIPLVMVMWDWLHGAVYGFTFLTLFVVGENAKHYLKWLQQQRKLSIADLKYLNRCFAITILAMLVNPFGLTSYGIFVGYVVGEANFNLVITEFTPVTWQDFQVFILMFAWMVLLALRHWRQLDVTQLLLVVVFGLAALRFNRVAGVAAIVMVPMIADLLRVSMIETGKKLERTFHAVTLLMAGSLMLWQGYSVKFGVDEPAPDSDKYHYVKVYDLSFGYRMDESIYPVGAVNFIREQKLAGHLYNSGNLGGYLSYRITPERKIFQYNMGRVFGDPLYYVRHHDDLAKWDINYAIVDTESEMSALFPDAGWATVYCDEASVLVVRRTRQNAALIAQHEVHYFSPVLSDASLLARAEDPAVLPVLAVEMGDYLDFRKDKRIATVWAEILAAHAELRSDQHIKALLERALKYNQVAMLQQLSGHS